MLSTRIAAAMIAITGSCVGNSYSYATDHFESKNRFYSHRQQHRSYYGGDGLPSHIGGVGTYAGGISAIRAPQNGIYFAADDGVGIRYSSTTRSAVRPRIIHVNKKTVGAECSYEAGVCVIRP
ncbi:hypothetical protein RRU01S_16_00830 [Agrobacterium rubi TR3 = NBRC 13261]|uniref:Uncharacterized protein n=1 Tax=Agrobacterium rubi TR3 = NBRC 13261 TaxID=1368415 RepID=A0A081CXC4_9HYPH|nr:hypothetical protein [Agrobacterium rubi]MBP1879745.1 hypothetical protein [Agrobacterium rubi]MCL6654441.1 hypothetical protein [Agrobacterium rubi]GAK71320.1 hypothetical protein RRU01S_16_00830 [Agrobacterium rubi TR3 = NBRC 13261]